MNNKYKILVILSLIFMVAVGTLQAEKYKGLIIKNTPKEKAGCLAGARVGELKLNNVRAHLETNGSMWFAQSKAEYEVPKGSSKTSMFAGALWLGGEDKDEQLYVAAVRFRQVGEDYWPGPLKMIGASIDPSSCAFYDKFYPMTRIDVERHKMAMATNDETYVMPENIKKWPAMGREGESRYLAPFYDVSGDGVYQPDEGDFPYYDLENELCPWTEANILRAMIPTWVNEQNQVDPLGKIPNPAALPIPHERVWTRQHADFGWDNKMIYADHVLKGDETMFWFLNDKGGPHTESGSLNAIGLEIRVQGFNFATNDELNNMTFYSYEIINRGSTQLLRTFFSQWADPDLGYAKDDYVGCDVDRGLGFCYNGTNKDGTGQIWAYGENPPAIGIDFFQGPYINADGMDNPKFYKDSADILGTAPQQDYCRRYVHNIVGLNPVYNPADPSSYYVHPERKDTLIFNNQFAINGVNFGDGIIDNERFGMRRYVYHNNTSDPINGDPSTAVQYYRMLRGLWKTGIFMRYGGDAAKNFPEGAPICNFMFPGNTDLCNWGTEGVTVPPMFNGGGNKGNWVEESPLGDNSTPNAVEDRRFMQSAGPFNLEPGACNYITVGIPWARTSSGGNKISVELLKIADDKCQALFENCFKIIDGPDAPILTIREYNQELIILISNSALGNNTNEDYVEGDPNIPEFLVIDTVIVDLHGRRSYKFEGYQIYQVSGPEVGAENLGDASKATLIAQFDIVNFRADGSGIGQLINWEYDPDLGTSVPRGKVNGKNTGIQHSLRITQDAFASGTSALVNYKTYYFLAVAYAYNEYMTFSIVDEQPNINLYNGGLKGQKLPYLAGRKNADGTTLKPISAIPHPPVNHLGGTVLKSEYGTIPPITRVDGQGNGGIALELSKETIAKIVSGGDDGTYKVRELTYEKNAGPLSIKVVDPLRVQPFDYVLRIIDTTGSKDVDSSSFWVLTIENATDEQLKKIGLTDNGKESGNPIREIKSQTAIGYYYEQIIFPLGIAISVNNADFSTGQEEVNKYWYNTKTGTGTRNGILTYCGQNKFKAKSIIKQCTRINLDNFGKEIVDVINSDPSKPWITGVIDDDGTQPSNWIRSGSYNLGKWAGDDQAVSTKGYYQWKLEDAFYPTDLVSKGTGLIRDPERAYKDPLATFAKTCGGIWSPYVLASPYDGGPQAKYTKPDNDYFIKAASGTDLAKVKQNEPKPNYYNFQNLSNYQLSGSSLMTQPGYNQTMTNLYSVNVVMTSDKSLWTRCPVLESCEDSAISIGKAFKNEPRMSLSVGKDGKPDGATDGVGDGGRYGMGWFPGYAVNIETGERLNMMFAENSSDVSNRGNDMIFNPTSTYAVATQEIILPFLRLFPGQPISQDFYNTILEILPDYFMNVVFPGIYDEVIAKWAMESEYVGIFRVLGGMHYVYVCGSSGNTDPTYFARGHASNGQFSNKIYRNFNANDTILKLKVGTEPEVSYGGALADGKPWYDCSAYDEGKWLVSKFKQFINEPETYPGITANHRWRLNNKMQLFNNVMYTHIPMQTPLQETNWLASDITFKIRVTRPYLRYTSRWYKSPDDREYEVPAELDNNGFPVFKFSTKEIAPTRHDQTVYKSILDKINIVPNPYYSGNLYETTNLTTLCKIINLPTDLKNNAPITINIFTVNGTLVRTLTKGDVETTYVDWDLKNYANIPIASGVYLIHVNVPGIGERMVKFFCTMRPTDLNTF